MMHLVSIAVHPDYRGSGLGRKLMRKMEEEAERLGVKGIWLEVKAGNSARIFYRKLGYREIIRIGRYYPDGSEAIQMVKELS